MKNFLAIILSLFCCSVAFAGSDVKLPVNHLEVKPYPGTASFMLNGKGGLHDKITYNMTCHINNPSKDPVVIKASIDPFTVAGVTLNSQSTGLSYALHLNPGVNTLVVFSVVAYTSNVKFVVENFDDTVSIFIDDCSAVIQ